MTTSVPSRSAARIAFEDEGPRSRQQVEPITAAAEARQAHDYGYGLVCGIDGKPLADGTIVLTGTNQEHGILTLPENSPLTQEDFPIGRRLRILPNHACPTAAPYASLVLIENGRVAEVLDHVRGWD